MKAILSGGGSAEQSKLVDEFFIKILNEKKVLFIPQAVAPETLSFEEVREWIDGHKAFRGTSVEIQENLSELTEDKMNYYGATYIGGGNTFKLLHELRENNLIELIKSFVEKPEKVVYGLSAGAIILGKNIKTASTGEEPDENSIEIKDLSGMNELNGYLVQPHYVNEKDDPEMFDLSKSEGSSIICVPETSGVFVDGKKAKVLGYDPIAIISEEKKISYNPGEEFEIKR